MTYIAVDSADRAVTRAREEGGTVVVPAFDAPPAGRMAVLRDPAGAAFCVWEANLRRGAQLVNEPSAWAMSALNTGDPDDAQHFYRATFGWETEPFGPDVTLFRLPRYVGGEPGQPVPRDVVAVMTAARTDPGWSVDIWVDDADAVAAKTIELGGTVEVAPREMAAFRNAVIADPQGARMSVSQLMVPAPAAG
jgi:predicted enzyme related to lactoylglutathione lyase